MSKLTATLQDLPNIVKYGLVIGAVIFISTLFPSNNRFPFTYEEGKNWDHENLFAPQYCSKIPNKQGRSSLKSLINREGAH